MKIKSLKNMFFASLLLAGLTLASCKNKSDDGDDKSSDDVESVSDTAVPEGMSSRPMGDTIITKNDTVVDTGAASDTKQNPVGEQVP